MSKLKIVFVLLAIMFFLTACEKDEVLIVDNNSIAVVGDSLVIDTAKAQDLLSKSFVIAHRGYWDSSHPQNSLSALKRALTLDIYGTEMDIHQTKDGLIVVNHDAQYAGLSIANSTYEELSKHRLNNGELLPLFESFLQTKKDIGGSVKLIVELKNCNVTNMLSLIDSYGLQDEVEYISFSTNLCNQLVGKGYGYKTYYLSGNLSPADVKAKGFGGIDYNDGNYCSNPGWIEEAQSLDLRTIVWTVNDMERVKIYVQKSVLVTTDKPVEASIVCNKLESDETFNRQNNN